MDNLEKTITTQITEYLDSTSLVALNNNQDFEQEYCSVTFDYICNYVVKKIDNDSRKLVAVVLRNLAYVGIIRVGYCFDINELVFGCPDARWLSTTESINQSSELFVYDEDEDTIDEDELSVSCISDLKFINEAYEEHLKNSLILQG